MAYPPGHIFTALTALLSAAVLLVAPISALAAPKRGGRSVKVATPFVKVATHPQAVTQPTALGKTIATLKSWNGKLYSGYGDYGANTGPISITPFDGMNFAPAPELIADTEATGLYRQINGKLWAPSIDPRVSSDFAVATGTSGAPAWSNPRLVSATHAFDIATLTGTDLWLVGSQGANALAWRSADGGSIWQQVLTVGPISGIANDFTRFYGAGVYDGKLYVQATDWYGGTHPISKVFDGTSWSDGPDLGLFNHAEAFAGRLIYHSNYQSGTYSGQLKAFDGTKQATVYSSGIYDYTIDAGTVYVLGADGQIRKSQDLITWTQVATAPSVGRSIAVFGGSVYVGGTDSGLYRYDLGTGVQ